MPRPRSRPCCATQGDGSGVGFYNYGRATNDKADAIAAQSSTEADPKKREALVKAALKEYKEP